MKSFLNSLKREDNGELIESIISAYEIIFENDEPKVYISEYKDIHTGFGVIEGNVNGSVVSKLYYKESPSITYTNDKNPKDYVYIEWIETKEKYRNKGYANVIVNRLVNKFPDKTVIARSNSMSASLMEKNGIVPITEASNPWYPPRTRDPLNLDTKGFTERTSHGINSAFKAMSNLTKKQFLDRYVPKNIRAEVYKQMDMNGKFPTGSKMPVYMIMDLPDDSVVSMAHNARELRNSEKDIIGRTKMKPKFDPNDPNTWSEHQITQHDAYMRQQKRELDALKAQAESDRNQMIEDGIIDEDGNFL